MSSGTHTLAIWTASGLSRLNMLLTPTTSSSFPTAFTFSRSSATVNCPASILPVIRSDLIVEPVGAENPVTVSDQGLLGQATSQLQLAGCPA